MRVDRILDSEHPFYHKECSFQLKQMSQGRQKEKDGKNYWKEGQH
jgi:hypothetical protein